MYLHLFFLFICSLQSHRMVSWAVSVMIKIPVKLAMPIAVLEVANVFVMMTTKRTRISHVVSIYTMWETVKPPFEECDHTRKNAPCGKFEPAYPGDVVAQLVERRSAPRYNGFHDQRFESVRSTRTICESFSESKSCADSLTMCTTPRVYTHAHEWSRTCVKDPVVHVRDRWITETRKHWTQEKQQQLGSAVPWLLAFPGESSPNIYISVYPLSPKGGREISDVSSLSGVSGLSVGSHFSI